MKSFSKITLQKRKGYREVFIYYSRHGLKFRESTNVKIFDQNIFDFERTLTENSNLEIIRKTHRQVEEVILRYLYENNEKPAVQWLRIEFDKVKIRNHLFPELQENAAAVASENFLKDKEEVKPKGAHNDLFIYWDDFILMKRQTIRNEGTIKRYNNLIVTIQKFKEKYVNAEYRIIVVESLTQVFFNDLLHYMVKEHHYFRATQKKDPHIVELPEIGLSNETTIKRITDLIESLIYCKRRKSV